MLKNIQMGLIHQELVNKPILDFSSKIKAELDSLNLETKINPGDRVAITAGSRGINNIDKIIKILIEYIKSLNANPFIFPAMGSHGGATAEGQIKILQDYGISEESMDVPIMATMEVKEFIKTKEGLSIYIDKIALEADHIIVVNRIKPHTKWKGSIESGLCKMMAIGMGKHIGAQYYHKYALQYGFPELLEIVAQNVIEKLPILFGLAIVEDGHDQTSMIEAIEPTNIIEKEKKLLLIAKDNLPKIPFEDIDILIIDEIGKEISGGGMDFNVIGRNRDIMNRWHSEQKVKRLFVRDITENSMGNGIGI
ncbi:MAG: lactate racemase domain-containing protein, partial [Atribacterota bacterium]|nr:lactate racemase domain-containing protein [Atribacterota bacterium]